MNSRDIQRRLVGLKRTCLWSPSKVLAAPNCCLAGWEADILLIQPSGWVTEIEIKISKSDLTAEFRDKEQKHAKLLAGSLIRRFYIALPAGLLEKIPDGTIPPHIGVISVPEHGRPKIVQAGKVLPGQKASEKDRQKLYESVYYKFHRHF